MVLLGSLLLIIDIAGYDIAFLLRYRIVPEKIKRAIKKYRGNHITPNSGNLLKAFWITKNMASIAIDDKNDTRPAFVTS